MIKARTFLPFLILFPQCALAQLNIVRIVPPNGTMRFTSAEAQVIDSLKDDSKLMSLNKEVYVKRVGKTVYCVSKRLPEFEELRDKLNLLTEILSYNNSEEVPFSKLSARSRDLLVAMLSGNRHQEIPQHELYQWGKLTFLPKEFVDYRSDKFGSFKIMAPPDLESLNPEQKKAFIERQYKKITAKLNSSSEKANDGTNKSFKPSEQSDAIETLIKTEDALNTRSPYRGFEISTNHALFSARDLSYIHKIAVEMIEEVKEIVRTECKESANRFLPYLSKIAPELFKERYQPVTEKDIERYKMALRQTLEIDKRSAKEIDSILQGIKVESRSIGLVMFVKVLEPNRKIVTHTPMIKF